MAVAYAPIVVDSGGLQSYCSAVSVSTSTASLPASNNLTRRRLTSESTINRPLNGEIVRHANGGYFRRWRTSIPHFQASLFPSLFQKKKSSEETRERLKEQLLDTIAPLDRGANATPQDQALIDKIASELESMNQVKEPLKSNFLNGKWELLYTTSQSVLQTQRPKFMRPYGKIYQAINLDTLRAQNMETWPFFNQITANLVPLNPRRTAVKFDYFKIAGLIRVKNPGSGRGQLEITYLDEELRISRGDKGNLFILRMVDPLYRVPL